LRSKKSTGPDRVRADEDLRNCVRETAFAKINLALHVRARRGDGYHELETLFAFVDVGDILIARVAERDALTTLGEFAGQLLPSPWGGVGGGGSAPSAMEHPHPDPPPQGGGRREFEAPLQQSQGAFGNLVARALAALPRAEGLAITLEKNLPVAAGLGGGSADAGAVFRIVRDRYGLPDDWRERAAKLGADVPACVESVTCIGRGTGTELAPADSSLAGTPVLLVNPRLPLATGPVFAGWDGIDRGPLPAGDARAMALEGRNDLEAPAIALCPAIAGVLAALRGTAPWLARMSGSGATCFALYESEAARDAASAQVRAVRPEWWQMRGRLR
jgi:4-diphosphocytidyl-2-C-methyl-D-erythritol kinase